MATPTQPATPLTINVAWLGDVRHAAALARDAAASIGFGPEHCEQIHLVVVEMATNLIRHASRGIIRLTSIHEGERVGIQIESEDDGPGIPDVEQAITDGYSTSDSLGLGLGTVNRLMDDLEIASGASTGLRVVCRRWVRPKPVGPQQKQIVFGVATRSRRLHPENGDGFIIRQWEDNAIAGVIDGLGHGELARRASQAARQYVEDHFDQPLDNIFRGTGRACRSTRGVVMALARFNLTRRTVTIANVGNIEVRLIGGPERFNMVVRRGVIGLNAPNPVSTENSWNESNLLIMHSDGVRTSWDWKQFAEVAGKTPDVIARRLLDTLGNIDDDATVLVARSAAT